MPTSTQTPQQMPTEKRARGATIGQKLMLGFGVAMLLFMLVGAMGYESTRALANSAESVTHTYEILQRIEALVPRVQDSESGQRGYLLTNNEDYLLFARGGRQRVHDLVREIRQLAKDNALQQTRLDALEPLLDAKFDEIEETLAVAPRDHDAAVRIVRTNRGREAMLRIRGILGQMRATELDLLGARRAEAEATSRNALRFIVAGSAGASFLALVVGIIVVRGITRSLNGLTEGAKRVGVGEFGYRVAIDARDELGALADVFNAMAARLGLSSERSRAAEWLKSNVAQLSQTIQGERDIGVMATRLLGGLAEVVSASQGAFFLRHDEGSAPFFRRAAGYAFVPHAGLKDDLPLGEGLVGQCAVGNIPIVVDVVPPDFFRVASGLGEALPRAALLVPAVYEGRTLGVIELAAPRPFSADQRELVEGVAKNLGVILKTMLANTRTEKLLVEAEAMTEELRSQAAELEAQQSQLEETNVSLEEQTQLLQASERELRLQQEELQQLNEELEEKATLVGEQNAMLVAKNAEVERARLAIERKAEELARSSKYKSEFLANMSHELRTPLNSMLILSRLLTENREGTLTAKQVEYAQTVHNAGVDLLRIINDVLDLARVESGKVEVHNASVSLADLATTLRSRYDEVARSKGLEFQVVVSERAPGAIVTDGGRLEQILNNLVGNAFKFTAEGKVEITMDAVDASALRGASGEPPAAGARAMALAIAVRDTGIGVAEDKQGIIFEAFQQADGSTSRNYGGTGLGLSISRELAALLGGEIHVESAPGVGSTFRLYLPERPASEVATVAKVAAPSGPRMIARHISPASPAGAAPVAAVAPARELPNELADDRASIAPGDRVVLVVEDDAAFARILMRFARERNFRVLATSRGETALALVAKYAVDAVLLDLTLPDIDGLAVIDRLKAEAATRHVPVHVISAAEQRGLSLSRGAIAYLEKPVTAENLEAIFADLGDLFADQVRTLLIVEDDEPQRRAMVALLTDDDIAIEAVGTAEEALSALARSRFDCVVLDLTLPDASGFELLERVKQQPGLQSTPFIIYTGRELSRDDELRLRRYSETIIVKDVRSPERLLDETALFLHRVKRALPDAKREVMKQFRDAGLAGKKVLVIDDDMRNVFALTSALESVEIAVVHAEGGAEGIEVLHATPDVDLALVDIMMPGMDGYETMRKIREEPRFRKLPLIALTAKAMKGDREKCLAAGASDYVTKPVDVPQLLSLLRVWLYK